MKEKDVQDGEMAEFYSSMSNTVAKKFTSKRNYQGNKLTPPATGSSTSGYENNSASNSNLNPTDLMSKGQKYVHGMKHQNMKWQKDSQNNVKKPKMEKPSLD